MRNLCSPIDRLTTGGEARGYIYHIYPVLFDTGSCPSLASVTTALPQVLGFSCKFSPWFQYVSTPAQQEALELAPTMANTDLYLDSLSFSTVGFRALVIIPRFKVKVSGKV
jgi:hypothetical protein